MFKIIKNGLTIFQGNYELLNEKLVLEDNSTYYVQFCPPEDEVSYTLIAYKDKREKVRFENVVSKKTIIIKTEINSEYRIELIKNV